MVTTFVPPLGAVDENVSLPDLASAAYEVLLSAQGDSDKSGTIEDACYYDGLVDALTWVLDKITTPQVTSTTRSTTSMAKPEHMEAIENVLDTTLDTAKTLERIPKVNLNGTTKNQQVVILTTTLAAGITLGVLGNNLIRRGINKLRRKKSYTEDIIVKTSPGDEYVTPAAE